MELPSGKPGGYSIWGMDCEFCPYEIPPGSTPLARRGGWFNLSGYARRLGQVTAYAHPSCVQALELETKKRKFGVPSGATCEFCEGSLKEESTSKLRRYAVGWVPLKGSVAGHLLSEAMGWAHDDCIQTKPNLPQDSLF